MTKAGIAIVTTARSPFDAQVIAGVLRGVGIPVYVGGQLLADEFAISRAIANLLWVEVQVPADRLEEARAALREADESASLLDDPSFDTGPREPGDVAGDRE